MNNITVEERIRNILVGLSVVCFICGKKSEPFDCSTCVVITNARAGIISLQNDFIKENAYIDRDVFRTVVSEHPPTCDDSGQPGWCQGELDKCLDALMAERPIRIR